MQRARPRYRQLILFLLVLILPSIAIIVAGRRIADQETKLAQEDTLRRAVAERKSMADTAGHVLLDRLERIKVQEMANSLNDVYSGAAMSSDPSIVGVGWLDGERLVWPWDADGLAKETDTPSPEITSLREEAERAEFSRGDYGRAVELYRQVSTATSGSERAAAQLGLARSLWRSGAKSAALDAYRALLQLATGIRDEYGLAYASYAVEPLFEMGVPRNILLERIQKDLKSQTPLSQLQTLRWRSAINQVAAGSPSLREEAAAAMGMITGWEQHVAAAAALQRDFPKLRVTDDAWQPYRASTGSPLWLVGRAPGGATHRPLVIAVNGSMLLNGLKQAVDIVEASDSGELLSPRLPGLRVAFRQDGRTSLPQPKMASSGLSLWALSFALIVMLTFGLGLVPSIR